MVIYASADCPDILRHVDGSPFDFREPHRVDYRIDMPDEHLRIMRGMSACWAVRNWDGTLRKAADLYDRKSGRGMQTWTTEPALLTFTGRSFDGTYKGKYGQPESATFSEHGPQAGTEISFRYGIPFLRKIKFTD